MTTDYFARQEQFRVNPVSILMFLAAAIGIWEANTLGQAIFPSLHLLPYIIRTTITFLMGSLLLIISFRLLRKNQIPGAALGLAPSKNTFPNILLGLLIGSASLVFIETVIYVSTPFRFRQGPLHGGDVLKEVCSFIVGNSLEELMFRGFLLVILSRLAGWRIGILLMAVPFGLFHLQGLGIGMAGLKMAATTATYSFVFSLSYVLTRSMWTAISVHVTSNVLLHTIFGLDGGNNSMFVQVFSGSKPTNYDLGFWALIVGAMATSSLLYVAVIFKLSRQHRVPISYERDSRRELKRDC